MQIASVTSQTPSAATPSPYPGLRRFNAAMGILHLAQGLFMLAISNATTFPITSNFLRFNLATHSLVPNPTVIYHLRFGPAVAIFLLLSAAAHFALSTFGYSWYVAHLQRGMNPARFYEYALSSSLMIVLIGMLVGVQDIGTLVLLFGLNAVMNLCGILMERANQAMTTTDWAPFIVGCIAGIVPWLVIFLYFYGSLSTSAAKPPTFVYAIIPTIFVFFNCFAINMFLQYRKVGPWQNYLFGERMFIVLSLLAKTALAWQIFVGTLRP